jgi:hypothetical protein
LHASGGRSNIPRSENPFIRFPEFPGQCSLAVMIRLLSLITLVSFDFDSPDGLAVDGDRLLLCCEGSGEVVSIGRSLSGTVVADGLRSPEGICVTPSGEILVTEDAPSGRILSIADGEVDVRAEGMSCPEGVACDPLGNTWFTTGGFEAGDLLTSLWTISEGSPVRVYSLPSLFSFSDMAVSSEGMVYVCSESSGLAGRVAVFSYCTSSGVFLPFVTGVRCCEGICLTNGGFPMYLVSEDGGIFEVDSTGSAVQLAMIAGTPEDAVVFQGRLAVSDDTSGSILWFDLHEH